MGLRLEQAAGKAGMSDLLDLALDELALVEKAIRRAAETLRRELDR